MITDPELIAALHLALANAEKAGVVQATVPVPIVALAADRLEALAKDDSETLNDLEHEIKRLRSRVEELKEALKPFLSYLDYKPPVWEVVPTTRSAMTRTITTLNHEVLKKLCEDAAPLSLERMGDDPG